MSSTAPGTDPVSGGPPSNRPRAGFPEGKLGWAANRRRRVPIGRWILVGLLGFALYDWTLGPYGIFRQMRVDRQIQGMRSENDSLRRANQDLAKRISRLENDTLELIREARRQGFGRHGEIVIRFVDTAAPPADK